MSKTIMMLGTGIAVLAALLLKSSAPFAQSDTEKFKIVTTIGQITDVARIIGGDRVIVQGLMGAGVDPHLYKASESDVNKLAQADIILYNGLFLEAKMEEILKKIGRSKMVVAVGEAVPVDARLESINYTGHYDPHIWFDVSLWSRVAQEIADTMIKADPAHEAEYRERAAAYQQELENLDAYVMNRASELAEDRRVLVTAHDAFRYFGRKYGFEVIGLQGISTQAEAGTKDVMALADLIAQRRIPAIFVESSVPERNIKAVQDAVRARQWDVKIGGQLFSDAMGDEGTFEGTYIGMVTHNIDTIVDALKDK